METEEGRALMLAGVLPAGTDRYVALYRGNPVGTGVELTLTGYARVGHQNWTTTITMPGHSMRANASPILFPNVTQAGTADYWAIFDAAIGGNLLRVGLVTDIIGVPSPIIFSGLGDQARFPIGALQIMLKDD